MTFSRGPRLSRALLYGFLAALLPAQSAVAALGEGPGSIDVERMRMHARKAVVRVQPAYTVHDLQTDDGSRIRQFVSTTGRVFAVTWITQYKPDMSRLLGGSALLYANAEREQGRRGGIQRHFRLDQQDLVVQSSAHLHVFSGYALLRSLLPAGFDVNLVTQE